MKELSVFIDESGDFGSYDYRSPWYIVALVLHDQDVDISHDLDVLNREIRTINLKDHTFHTGPLIRGEEEFRYLSEEERRRVFMKMMSFFRHVDIRYAFAVVEKKHTDNTVDIAASLAKSISSSIRNNYSYFMGFDKVKVYYDNGQNELNRILASVFNVLLENVEFRKVIPSEYRLFQVADMLCTLKLAELKMNDHLLSKSELHFFRDVRTLKKNYLKVIEKKEM